MFSLTRTISFSAAAALSLALIAGCKTSGQKPEAAVPTTPTVPSVSGTKTPPPPAVALPPDSGDSMAPNILAWDAVSKEYHAKPGELKAPFTFNLTNVSTGPVTIYDTSTTCDCTVASLPSKPWTLASGASGKIEATIDLSKKTGVVTNAIIVFTSQGNRRLKVKAITSDSQ
ncbi:MAG TPA: DUF1573 domain-containing protein [Verrucomicrobiae bacterium]|jgi:hypothetical protein